MSECCTRVQHFSIQCTLRLVFMLVAAVGVAVAGVIRPSIRITVGTVAVRINSAITSGDDLHALNDCHGVEVARVFPGFRLDRLEFNGCDLVTVVVQLESTCTQTGKGERVKSTHVLQPPKGVGSANDLQWHAPLSSGTRPVVTNARRTPAMNAWSRMRPSKNSTRLRRPSNITGFGGLKGGSGLRLSRAVRRATRHVLKYSRSALYKK